MKKAPALILPALLLLTLTGCDPVGSGGSGDGSDGSDSGGELEGGSTACLVDKDWQLDIADAARQIGDNLASNGLNVVSSTGEGEQSIFFDQEGIAGSSTSVSYTMVVDMGDGLVMTMVQHHEGSPGGEWAWDGSAESTLVFSNWESDYVITTDTSINGTAAPTTVTPTGGGLNGQSMTVSCDGDTLQTQAEGSPFTQTWHAG